MTGKQTGVLWAGLILVGLRFFTTGQFDVLWSTITTGADGLKHQTDTPQTPGNPQGGGHALTPV